MGHPGKKEKLREMCFSGLKTTKQEGESNSSLLAVYLQGVAEMIEAEIKVKGQEAAVTRCSNRTGGWTGGKYLL